MTKVGIIGGYGGMGSLFAEMLKRNGFEVAIAGPRENKGRDAAKRLAVSYERDNKILAAESDIIIISVPIKKTYDVIAEIIPHLRPGSLVMDLTSVKKGPCDAMSAAPDDVEVVGCHPVFGPMVGSFEGQNFVFCPIRQGPRFKEFIATIKKEGAKITVCTPEEHDSAMAVVQGMTHFMLISAGLAMKELDFSSDDAKKFSSPVYRLATDLVGRVLGQDPGLYAQIQLNNPHAKLAREEYLAAAGKLDKMIRDGDGNGFIRAMQDSAKHFGDTKGAIARTQKILSERDKKK